jgi:hypothetical protein
VFRERAAEEGGSAMNLAIDTIILDLPSLIRAAFSSIVLCSVGVLLALAALSKSVGSSFGVNRSAVKEHGAGRAPDHAELVCS